MVDHDLTQRCPEHCMRSFSKPRFSSWEPRKNRRMQSRLQSDMQDLLWVLRLRRGATTAHLPSCKRSSRNLDLLAVAFVGNHGLITFQTHVACTNIMGNRRLKTLLDKALSTLQGGLPCLDKRPEQVPVRARVSALLTTKPLPHRNGKPHPEPPQSFERPSKSTGPVE